MTNMRRICVAIPDSLDQKILALRKEDNYVRLTYSEIVRQLLENAVPALSDPTEGERREVKQ